MYSKAANKSGKVSFIFTLVLTIFLSILIMSCDDPGGSSGGGDIDEDCKIKNNPDAPTKVVWSITDGNTLEWDNAADVTYWDNGDEYSIEITWNCADYEDDKNAYVVLTFWDWFGDGKGWILETTFIDPSGICEGKCL
jgi:hypothetical protein